MSVFSKRLKQLRNEMGYNQEQFAKLLNISRRAYQYYENDSRVPDANKLLDIATKLDVSTSYLLGDDEIKNLVSYSTFARRLRELRISHSLTQLELSDHLDVSSSAINSYESGRSFPKFDQLIKLADYFDVSLDYLVGRSDNPKRN